MGKSKKEYKDQKQKKLLEITRCLPFEQACDGEQKVYFRSGICDVSGFLSIINTSSSSIIEVEIIEEDRHRTVKIYPGSSYAQYSSGLKKIGLSSSGDERFSTGSIEMNLWKIIVY